ncbi:hypothetical protein LTR86_008332 [Recurvomyces mirabilis]|nr:hypothetical protein LTR86_008332 [Recurvomyces mirabilis]
MQTVVAVSAHLELINTLTELYTLFDALGATRGLGLCTPPYKAGEINKDAASTAGYDAEVIELMTMLPYLDVADHYLELEIQPSTYPISYVGEQLDVGYFESQRELYNDDLTAPCALRLTFGEGSYGTEFIYDTNTKHLIPWHPMANAEDQDGYFYLSGGPPREVLEPLISKCQQLLYFGTPEGLDFRYEFYHDSGGQPPVDWDAKSQRQWLASYNVWAAARKIRDMYLDCGWNISTSDQPGFRRDELLDRRTAYWAEIVQPLLDIEERT